MLRHVFLLCGIIVAIAWSVQGMTEQEHKKIDKELFSRLSECAPQFGLSADEIETVRKEGHVDELDPCLFACFFKKIEIMDDKGLFLPEKAAENVKKFISSEDDEKKLVEIGKICSSVNDKSVSDGDKGCERAKLLHDCLVKHESELPIASI